MKSFKTDLHIHSLLSPCGELEMSPEMIIKKASEEKLDIIGITDHNSTRQAPLIQKLGEKNNILVLLGAEVTSKEEVHCLCFLPDEKNRLAFQEYLDLKLPNIPNDPLQFGDQIVVNEAEEIIFEEQRLLISAISASVDEIAKKVASLDGIFIPAHIDKKSFSLISQLGFVPPDIQADALELSFRKNRNSILETAPYLKKFSFIHSSDAHQLDLIGSHYSIFKMEEKSFKNISSALRNQANQQILLVE